MIRDNMSECVCVCGEVGGVVLDLLNLEPGGGRQHSTHSRANTQICQRAESAYI